ncbi:MAG: hypothetical protein OXI22_03520 [Defluviicoccus sp.]|nr:hypothetical protein [Defluviicoccus sp.]MDE0382930.1 hypothetical protein [Defluviicoccus sp.]
MREAIQAADAELRFLSHYSPDLNPIEMAFTKFKTCLKRRAARTLGELDKAVAQAVSTYIPNECQNYFTAAEYDCKCSENALETIWVQARSTEIGTPHQRMADRRRMWGRGGDLRRLRLQPTFRLVEARPGLLPLANHDLPDRAARRRAQRTLNCTVGNEDRRGRVREGVGLAPRPGLGPDVASPGFR